MNPMTLAAAKRLYQDVRKGIAHQRGAHVVVAPPFIYLSEISKQSLSKTVHLGAQDAFWEKLGARTGEVSAAMLKNLKVSHVIVGHSERRALGESNEEVNKKVHTLLKEGMTAVVCVGEERRDNSGNYLNHIEKQVRRASEGVGKAKLGQLVIAYEPIWAIGSGKSESPADVHEMRLFIQKTLTDIYGRNMAARVRVLYGGSVKPDNAHALMEEGAIDGFLVGGASLKANDFVSIVKTASSFS